MRKTALIVGAEGQDGSYLFEKLQAEEYSVIGLDKDKIRHTFSEPVEAVDITQTEQVYRLVKKYKPDEIYYLAAFHHSSEEIGYNDIELFSKSYLINVFSLINFLDAMAKYSKLSRLFCAGSSHMFGNPDKNTQDEQTPFNPSCVYGISKTAGVSACRYYRNKHSLFASAGILYNHESPRRAKNFVSQKIIKAAVAIKKNMSGKLILGDINAKVDWGYAPDYVEAMYLILQQPVPEDFIIASGGSRTIKQFVEIAFGKLDLNWKKYVEEDPSLIQKTKKNNLQGDIKKIGQKIGWKPPTSFDKMIGIMIDAEMENTR
ncbi:GDP-mannose 4,6-dehydratase [bacterium]|nr:NAD-dependent epimerase/dehydratase family protein [bacterium]MBU2529275.1 GDP-mannose 4,6-dehydratase [bacterium]MBU3930246.1 GDP-mannose 4,6-dehydratase [bacterium]